MLRIDIEMVESFKNLTKSIVNFFEKNLFKDTDVSCSEFSVIKTIHEFEKKNEKVNITEVANSLKMTKSAVSQIVSKLEKKGLVKRKISLKDKKIYYLTVSEEASSKCESKYLEGEHIIKEVVNQMGEKDITELSRLIDKLSNVINDLGKVEEIC